MKNFYLSKRLKFILFILGLFAPPVIFAMPWPIYSGIYKLKITEVQKETNEKEVSIPLDVQSMGKTIFSKISGVRTYNYQTNVCLFNWNKVILDKDAKNQQTLIDKKEAGAMEIFIRYPNNATTSIYAPLNSLRCSELLLDTSTSSPAHLMNNPIFRHPIPIGNLIVETSKNETIIKVPIFQTSEIDSSKTRVFTFPKFYTKTFILNIIIFFIAWSIIYLHLLELYEFGRILYLKSYKIKGRKND